jgi:SpoIID/LytB domain protein
VTRTFSVDLRGNGHGHGLSQYGAQGAAQEGLTYRQILAFYYPGTKLQTWAPATIRVLISHPGDATTIAAQRGLHVSGMSEVLPTAGVRKYRFVAGQRRGIGLFALGSSGWQLVRWGLPARTSIRRPGPVRVYLGDGSSTAYRQTILAVRRTTSGATGLLTINRVSMDNYVAGVVPREMPASWDPAALRAQAVAVRSYARYEADHNPGNPYDICDTSMCQVYGGAAHWAADGTLEWTDDPAAVLGDENQYLTYQGAAILAQFSASNGGWTVSGGMPYLPAKQDPYDSSSAAADPYALYQATVRSADVASYFGLAKLTGIAIIKRDGNGAWGGRVVTAQVSGRDSSGASKTITTDGQNLQWAMGLGTDWFRLTPDNAPRGQLGSVRKARSGLRVTGWAVDTDHAAISPRVRVRLDGKVAAVFHTHVRRPRIVHHFALAYRKPGFHALYRARSGRHRVCVAVLDSNGLRPKQLGCRTIRLPG